MRYQPLAPVGVSVLAEGEARQLRYDPPMSTEELTEHYGRRCARVLTEAYAQDGLPAVVVAVSVRCLKGDIAKVWPLDASRQ